MGNFYLQACAYLAKLAIENSQPPEILLPIPDPNPATQENLNPGKPMPAEVLKDYPEMDAIAPALPKAEADNSGTQLESVIAREKQGDYCLPCVSSKHLHRVKDALADAKNILTTEGQFTEVAEGKIQEAVYNLNAAEVDLERANYPEIIKPAVEAMHTQVRKLRNFLRPDQSGLELATVTAPKKEYLEKAIAVTEDLSKLGYNLTKLLIKARTQER